MDLGSGLCPTSSPFAPRERSDYARISAALDTWWGDRHMSALFQPLFLENFSTTSLICEDSKELRGFLVGFPSIDDAREAYVHFLGVSPELRGLGLGRELYAQFDEGNELSRGDTSALCDIYRQFSLRGVSHGYWVPGRWIHECHWN